MRPYEIFWSGYTHQSGGVRALWALRDELRARGCQAWMSAEQHDTTAIGIYPEVISDNPGGFKALTRWLLNKATLPDDGLKFAWASGMGDYPLLTINIIEQGLFTPRRGLRHGTAYWVGKGVLDERFVPDNSFHITKENVPTREALADLIGGLDYLISFDPFSSLNTEAICLGTPVLIRCGAGRWQQQEIQSHGWLPYGVAWSMDELPAARANVHLAHDHYTSLFPVFARTVDEYVERTQAAYG